MELIHLFAIVHSTGKWYLKHIFYTDSISQNEKDYTDRLCFQKQITLLFATSLETIYYADT